VEIKLKGQVMKKLVGLSLFVLTGCVSTPVVNQADLQNVNFAELLQQKTNQACQTMLFGILPIGPGASIAQAAWEAEIEKVSYAEISTMYLLPFATQKCVIIYGE